MEATYRDIMILYNIGPLNYASRKATCLWLSTEIHTDFVLGYLPADSRDVALHGYLGLDGGVSLDGIFLSC